MRERLSRRLEGFAQSDIRRMSIECEKVGGINLGQGICDLATESLVADGAIEAIRDGRSTYSRLDGIAPLREAIAEKLRSYNGMTVDPENEVVVTIGATGGFATAAMATLDPGDEVVLFEPFYGYHHNPLLTLEVGIRFVELKRPGWSFSEGDLRAAFSDRTKGIVVCTPSNPCGKVFTREELEMIGRIAEEHDAWIYTDEIYEYIVYDEHRHLSLGSIDRFRDRTITISGFSKTFSITGWRIGYVSAAAPVANAIGLLNDMFYVCAPTPLQWGVTAGVEIDESYYVDMASDYQKKRDMLAEALEDAGMTPYVPQGAYYMLAEVNGAEDAKTTADRLLSEVGVAAVPGGAFYRENRGDHVIRFCFAKSFEDLEEACRRIRKFKV
ncbi:MAG: pyridoxal phosphate-dependent aminotransferase [Thermoanaerobaculia bacterium]|nr:pyridoxal phosphate-dependent aminotransferase [Thermoanaerobaculia bacterium]